MTGQEVLYIVIAIAVSLAVIILESFALWYATNPQKDENKKEYYKQKIQILENEKEFYRRNCESLRIFINCYEKQIKENEPNRS